MSEIIQLKEMTEVLQNLVSVGRANMLILLHMIDTCVPGCESNRPFPNYLWPLFQSESWCSSFDMKISFHSHANEN